jgi:hypothetical protein
VFHFRVCLLFAMPNLSYTLGMHPTISAVVHGWGIICASDIQMHVPSLSTALYSVLQLRKESHRRQCF